MKSILTLLAALPMVASQTMSGPGWQATFHSGTRVSISGTEIGFPGSRSAEPAAERGRTRYASIYPGIHLDFYRSGNDLEYDFVVDPGADPSRIAVRFEAGATIEPDGDLAVRVPGGSIRQKPPVTYQWRRGHREIIPSGYVSAGDGLVGFALGPYDRSLPLVIDPVLTLSRVGGTPEAELTPRAAQDAAGNFYFISQLSSRLRKTTSTGAEVFVTQMPAGFGAKDVAVDGSGNIFLAANSPDCIPGATNTAGTAGTAFMVLKLSPDGQTQNYLTCIRTNGGSATNRPTRLTVDTAGNAYITGASNSSSFPATANFGTLMAGLEHAFVAKLSPNGAILYSVVTGNDTLPTGIAVDAAGNAYVTGSTDPRFEQRGQPLQAQYGGGTWDAFVMKITPNGDNIPFASFLGSAGQDGGDSIGLDSAGNVIVAGSTTSSGFPSAGPFARPYAGGINDAFITKLTPNGPTSFAVAYSTFLGGANWDGASSVSVRPNGEAIVAGVTGSTDFFLRDPTLSQPARYFAATLAPNGEFLFSTYAGVLESGSAVNAFGTPTGFALIGFTASPDFPRTTGPALGGSRDWFLQVYERSADLELRIDVFSSYRRASVRNLGPDAAASVQLIIGGPGVTVSGPGCIGPFQQGFFRCLFGTIRPGQEISAQLSLSGTAAGQVTSGTHDPNLNNNTVQ